MTKKACTIIATLTVTLAACGGSADPATSSSATTVVSTTTHVATTTIPATTIAATTTTDPEYRTAVKECRDKANTEMPAQARQGAAVMQQAFDACNDALGMLFDLTGKAGADAFDLTEALSTFLFTLGKAQVDLKYDFYDEDAESGLYTAVLEVQVAIGEYLNPAA